MHYVKRFVAIVNVICLYIRFKVRQFRRKTFEKTVVDTIYGPVRGIKRYSCWRDSFFSFEKIPFAKPPLGDLRFKAPVPPDPWEKPLNCSREGSIPLQVNLIVKSLEGAEDCLYLNVYTKKLEHEKPWPVMVWIYGGGFETGGATKDLYSPDYFMRKDIVLVTINYRVGPFGFLSVKDPSVNVPGNAGLKDQVMALKWVQNNIKNFGGDPNNVTIFGESAGGASVHYLTLPEKTKGLFHKAILMSGSVFAPWARLPEHDFTYRLAKAIGYDGERDDNKIYQFLKKCKGSALAIADSKLLTPEEKRNRILFASGPVVEPYDSESCLFHKDPRLMARESWGNQIPLILGGNSFEGLFAFPDVIRNRSIIKNIENCEYLVPLELGLDRNSEYCKELGMRLKKIHFGDEEPALMPYLHLLSYKYFWHPLHRALQSRVKYASAATYLYRFDFDSAHFNHVRIICCGKKIRGVSHADDLSYMFYNAVAEDLKPTTAEYKTIQRLVGMWTEFAYKGDPNCDLIKPVVWKPSTNIEKPFKCLNISDEVSVVDLPESRNLMVWDSLYPEDSLI